MTYGIASKGTEEILTAVGLAAATENFDRGERTIEIDVIFQGALEEVFRVHADQVDEVFDALVANFTTEFPGLDWTVSIYDRTNDEDPVRWREIDHEGPT